MLLRRLAGGLLGRATGLQVEGVEKEGEKEARNLGLISGLIFGLILFTLNFDTFTT